MISGLDDHHLDCYNILCIDSMIYSYRTHYFVVKFDRLDTTVCFIKYFYPRILYTTYTKYTKESRASSIILCIPYMAIRIEKRLYRRRR